MGKQRRVRQKYHTTSLTKPKLPFSQNISQNPIKFENITPIAIKENPFEGMKISFDQLKTKLNDDTQSVKSFKSIKSEIAGDRHLTKTEKRKIKRQMILTKLDVVEQARKATKQKKQREKTAITGDLFPLFDALPSLESLKPLSKPKSTDNSQNKTSKCRSRKQRHKKMLENAKLYKKILTNSNFKNDPKQAVTMHLNNTILKKI